MEINSEPKSNQEGTPPRKRVPKLVFKIRRRVRHFLDRLAEDLATLKKDDFRETRHMVRRVYRRALKAVEIQWDELRLAARELRARVQSELQPVEPASEKAPPIGKTLLPRESRPATPSAARPAALRESTLKIDRVLVVGGMEFLGAAIVRHLNRQGVRNIVVADSLEKDCWQNLPALQFEEFLSLPELAQGLANRGRTLGVFSHVFYCGDWDAGESPLALPKALLAAAVESGGRFVALASAASLGPEPNRKDILKSHAEKFRPRTRAGVMSCLFDRHAIALVPPRSYLSLKHYRLFGPGERRDGVLYGLASEVHDQILAKSRIRLPSCLNPGEPEGCREHDFLYVGSAAAMAVWLAETESSSGIYELGSGRPARAIDLVRAIASAHGVKPDVDWRPEACSLPSPEPACADLARLRELGWKAEEPPLEVMVKTFVESLLHGGEPEVVKSVPAEIAPVKKELAPSPSPRIFPSRKKPFLPRASG